VLDVGVRAINTLLTVGRGQRLACSREAALARCSSGHDGALHQRRRCGGRADRRARAQVRGSENILGAEGLARSVVVAVPADSPPLTRLNGAAMPLRWPSFSAIGQTCAADHGFATLRHGAARGQSGHWRAPATKGYAVGICKLPQLVERAGNGPDEHGSITAFYTVLAEGDDQQDPIADAARAILDGHIVLTRDLADQGHYPAIDIGPQSAAP
jgi:flagellum-specific ATP synthase